MGNYNCYNKMNQDDDDEDVVNDEGDEVEREEIERKKKAGRRLTIRPSINTFTANPKSRPH
jgi:hypothetical protein